jgi:preprotein translocase subunit YajC
MERRGRTMKQIDYNTLKVGDKVITRDGREGRVICTDLNNPQPIAVAVWSNSKGTREHINQYLKNGKVSDSDNMMQDIFLPPKKEYVNLYREDNGFFRVTPNPYQSKSEAENMSDYADERGWTYIKTIEVEV